MQKLTLQTNVKRKYQCQCTTRGRPFCTNCHFCVRSTTTTVSGHFFFARFCIATTRINWICLCARRAFKWRNGSLDLAFVCCVTSARYARARHLFLCRASVSRARLHYYYVTKYEQDDLARASKRTNERTISSFLNDKLSGHHTSERGKEENRLNGRAAFRLRSPKLK